MEFSLLGTQEDIFNDAIEAVFARVEGSKKYHVEHFDNDHLFKKALVSITNESGEEITKLVIDIYPDGGEYKADVMDIEIEF
ncbi:hypothetical protein [Brevibacillus daliensis]|uniref:hypothetical protein n=1 Tax=Brevibacillus daliensis TaxID=2892995 RepID=UPI001E545F7B|nr:hypothetical protein [Brevibacillus daliensis]